ncbi:M15 family metallopeptidase [Dokdonia sp. Hel_I_53]|uniref:M15 family metallopeptidase n=1 Tax=Dokdonia sp. Hel_I_53 TaxID=1566287 RepID=UPI00119B458B|nr:M15 family metallopeptidase [Dokdonia sp. Hel_I_53]TVZ51612.1 D-alanyl-D-alanine dipeptidase [Dokdonia sp. Hel_I_53]
MRIYRTLLLLMIGATFFAFQSDQESPLINVDQFASEFAYDVRYATDDNFLKQTVYDCVQCLLIPEVAKALVSANDEFCELGYKIKLFDCYRPVSVQKKMWDIFPNPGYVGNPYKSGSIHNRGAAIDMTIVTLKDSILDMGSDYDHFGKEAHIDHPHNETIVANRKLLWSIMKKHGFSPIRTEWWHFNYDEKNYGLKVLDLDFDCE